MTSVHASAWRRRSLGLARMLKIGIAHCRDRSRIRREMASLADLPDHLLRDMGIEEQIARRIRSLSPGWH